MKIALASILPNYESWVTHFKYIPKSSNFGIEKNYHHEKYDLSFVTKKNKVREL